MGIDMLLDSDDDDLDMKYQDDNALIEKDLDNWIWSNHQLSGQINVKLIIKWLFN